MLYERENGLPQIRVIDLRSGQSQRIAFPEPAYAAYSYVNRVYDTTEFRYGYQSPITPASVFAYDMEKGTSTLLKQKEVPGGYDRTKYQVEQIYAPAADGVKIPISVLHLKGAKLDGKGSAVFVWVWVVWGIDRHVFQSEYFQHGRSGSGDGGGAYSRRWRNGQGLARRGAHDEQEDDVHRLHFVRGISGGQGYGSKDRLVIEGRSAGGLLMGAVLNMRPDLFKAALVGVPFVDVMNTMLDETLPLTVGEFEEWGNPKEKAAFDYMVTYSPYDNVEAKKYPDMLVKTSFNDSQVMYWEPAKYVAKMRATRTDHNILILKTNLSRRDMAGLRGDMTG